LPKHWLFQFNPQIYRWLDRNNEKKKPEQWLVSQHSTLIRNGDLVAIWGAGQNSGIYAIGQTVTNPKNAPLDPEQAAYFHNELDVQKFLEKPSVMVSYFRILNTPIFQQECNKDPLLSDLQVLMNPQGTNFRLRTEQWDRIRKIIEQH
jgi:hypothetical protein